MENGKLENGKLGKREPGARELPGLRLRVFCCGSAGGWGAGGAAGERGGAL